MRRREFLVVVGGAAAWPVAARGQQSAPLPVVGYLGTGSVETSVKMVAAFRAGLSEMGFAEGRNVTIEYRWADNEYGRLPELAADLAHRRVTVMAVPQSVPAALAAKAATTTVPIIFSMGADPVQFGIVASLNRPGANMTGIATMGTEVEEKRFAILHELVANAGRFAMLANPTNPNFKSLTNGIKTTAARAGRPINVVTASTNREIDAAFERMAEQRVVAIEVGVDPLFTNRRLQLATLAVYHRIPAIYANREHIDVGGLISYGTDIREIYRQVGLYTARVLKGEKPATLPVMRPTKFELVINLQTARTLRVAIPPTLLALADEVIE